MSRRLRVNQDINSPKVLLIEGEDMVGEVSLEEALKRAVAKKLDLVEVSPMSSPPVCKIMDFGTYLYSQKKKDKKQKKGQKQVETKTIRMSIRTESHDLEIKAKQTRKFLLGRHTVKVVIIFRGREMAHQDLAESKMSQFLKLIEDVANVEQMPKRQGFQMTMIVNPLKK